MKNGELAGNWGKQTRLVHFARCGGLTATCTSSTTPTDELPVCAVDTACLQRSTTCFQSPIMSFVYCMFSPARSLTFFLIRIFSLTNRSQAADIRNRSNLLGAQLFGSLYWKQPRLGGEKIEIFCLTSVVSSFTIFVCIFHQMLTNVDRLRVYYAKDRY